MKFKEEIIVFLVGMSIMVLELVGSRLLAPFLGTSIYVWTSLIGVILASLSLGYYFGGRLADKKPSYQTLALIIFSGAVLIFLVSRLQYPLLDFFSKNIVDLRFGSVLAGIVLFSAPSTLLAMVSPYIVRLKMKSVAGSGKTVGNLYAISTVGSIFGTFLAGFVLISYFSNSQILLIESAILVITAFIAVFPVVKKVYVFLALLCLGFAFGFSGKNLPEKYLVWKDTPYQTLKVLDSSFGNENVRVLRTDPFGTQGAVYKGKDDLVFDYLKYFDIYQFFKPDATKALMIGAGVYAYPRHYLATNHRGIMDVVDIDPGVTEVSRNFFSLGNHKNLNIFHEDGRIFVNRTQTIYDVVFLDAFNSLTVPFQLTTLEFLQSVKSRLSKNGLLVTNVIASLEGKNSKFLQASLKTYQRIFSDVSIFAVEDKNKTEQIQNIILVGTNAKVESNLAVINPILMKYLDSKVKVKVEPNLPVLTDNFAPVDSYMLSLFENKRSADF